MSFSFPVNDSTGFSNCSLVAAQCYGMGPLIDEQLNQLDQEHVKLSELNKKVIDALNMYHKLMEQSPAQQSLGPSMTSYGGTVPPPAMNIHQHPTYPVRFISACQFCIALFTFQLTCLSVE